MELPSKYIEDFSFNSTLSIIVSNCHEISWSSHRKLETLDLTLLLSSL